MRAPAKPIPAARPSFARVALSGLYKNRRAYRALAAGVFLSIFFVSTMGLSLYSLLRGSEARYRAQVGMQDAILYRAQAIDPAFLRENGLAEQVGSVYAIGTLASAAMPSSVVIGQMDETAQALLQPTCAQGRLPARPGEIALESSALKQLGLNALVGASISLQLTPFGGETREAAYTLVGVLEEQSAFLQSGAGENAYPAALLFAPNLSRPVPRPRRTACSRCRGPLRSRPFCGNAWTPCAPDAASLQTLYAALARQGYDTAAVSLPLGRRKPLSTGHGLRHGPGAGGVRLGGHCQRLFCRLNARLSRWACCARWARPTADPPPFCPRGAVLFALCTPAAFALSCLAHGWRWARSTFRARWSRPSCCWRPWACCSPANALRARLKPEGLPAKRF